MATRTPKQQNHDPHATSPLSFGTALRQERKRAGMTQGEFADAAGYSFTYISNLENHQRLPDIEVVREKFIPALGLQHDTNASHQLLELARTARGLRPTPNDSSSHRNDGQLRSPLWTIYGREQEVENICSFFLSENKRCVTLLGPPGIGKTTLGALVANRLAAYYEDGVYFVALAAVSEAERFGPTLMSAIYLADAPNSNRSAQQRLIEHLRNRKTLIVLDNFEQILSAASQVAELLAECPELHLLITSRAPLGIRVEQRFPVKGLTLAASVKLFEERARTVDPDFAITETTKPVVEQICHRLDCLPLAIELIAPQVTLFTPEEMAQQLEKQRLHLLETNAADREPRHWTLRRAIEQSYQLLSTEEQTFFRKLGIFTGGFDLDAVSATIQVKLEDRNSTAKLLGNLINKSLVQTETLKGNRKKFSLLETIREFALEKLRANNEYEATRNRHAEYFCALAAESFWGSFGPDELVYWERITINLESIRAILNWSINCALDDPNLEYALILIGGLVRFWYCRGYFREAIYWSRLGLEKSEGRNDLQRAKILQCAWLFAWARGEEGNLEVVQKLSAGAVACFRRCSDDPRELGIALQNWSVSGWKEQDALNALAEARELFRKSHWKYGIAWANLFEHTIMQPYVQHVPTEESVQIMREIDAKNGLALALHCLAQKKLYAEAFSEALACIQESVHLYKKLEEKWVLAQALMLLGDTMYNQGMLDGVTTVYSESIAIAELLDDRMTIANARERLDVLERGLNTIKSYWIVPEQP